jgi:NADPH:quinone reductase-like Zn-dependent oxidoreductase
MRSEKLESEAIMALKRGGPEGLVLRAIQLDQPGPGEVRVRMLAAGVSYADLMIREGVYPIDLPWPRTPGYEIVAEIEATGPDVEPQLAVGTRVAALTVEGSYARHRILPAAWCVPLPGAVAPERAVALVLNYLTAYQMLRRVAQLEPGDSVVVHAAAGGVGTAVLELARLFELRVFGLCSKHKHEFVERLGGIPIDYRHEDVEARVRQLNGGKGVHAVLDAVGGHENARSFRMLRQTGRVVCYGWLALSPEGRRNVLATLRTLITMPRFSALSLYMQAKGVCGYHADRWRTQRPTLYRQDLAWLLERLAEGQLAPHIDEQLPLAAAARAQRKLGQGGSTGKLVLLNS